MAPKSVAEMMTESADDAAAIAEMQKLEEEIAKDPGTPAFVPPEAKTPKEKKAKTPKEPKAPKEPKEPKKPGRKSAIDESALYERTTKTAREGSTAAAIVNALTGEPKTLQGWVDASGRSRGDIQAAYRAGYIQRVGGEPEPAPEPAPEAGDQAPQGDQAPDTVLA